MTKKAPVADGLFTWPSDEPQLIGSSCARCEIVTFPSQSACPRCASTEMVEHLLPRRGRLWAWTTQEFAPPSPPYEGATGAEFEPFGIGYIDLAGEVKVESRLTESRADVLHAGMEMELTIVLFRIAQDGTEIVTFAFRPLG
ncbi:MAG: OB-fold domain-containing protein [Acidimicrobiales bacterium]